MACGYISTHNVGSSAGKAIKAHLLNKKESNFFGSCSGSDSFEDQKNYAEDQEPLTIDS